MPRQGCPWAGLPDLYIELACLGHYNPGLTAAFPGGYRSKCSQIWRQPLDPPIHPLYH